MSKIVVNTLSASSEKQRSLMFIALITQDGEGCVYTIDCGKKWLELKAVDKDEAMQELRKEVIGKLDDGYQSGFDGRFLGESKLSEVILLEVSDNIKIPIGEWYSDAETILKRTRDEAKLKIERAEYERLKSKFARD